MLITLDWEKKKRDSCSKAFRYFLLHQLMEKENFFSYEDMLFTSLIKNCWEWSYVQKTGKKNNCICQIFNFEGFLGHWYVTQSSWNARNVLGIHLWPAVEEQGGARKWKKKVLWKKYSIPNGSRRVLFHSVGSLHCSKILPRWIFRQL